MIVAGEISYSSNYQQEAGTIKRTRKKKTQRRMNTQNLTNNKEIRQITANYYFKKSSLVVTASNIEMKK